MDPPSRRPNKHRYSAIQAVVEPSYPRWMRRSISPTRPTDPLVRGCAIINSPCRRIAMATIEAWVAPAAKSSLVRQKVELGPLGDEEVEVEVEHCGLCHSDLSIRNNDWGFSQFPAVLGHEAVGRVVEVGRAAKGLTVGQRVGVGWTAGSCMHCRQCMSGNHHLCPQATFTIVGHKGAFASRVRAHWGWAVPLPEKINVAEAGPLLCGGMTVFNPLAMYAKPTSRVGIVGIGGLGHMAVKFGLFRLKVRTPHRIMKWHDPGRSADHSDAIDLINSNSRGRLWPASPSNSTCLQVSRSPRTNVIRRATASRS